MSHQNEKKVIHSIRTEVDSFGRKKYRLQEVAQQSASEQEAPQNASIIDTGRHKSMLISRDEGLNIEKYVGKIDTNKKKKVTEVFYCDICSEGFKCDMAYITHLNSPAHNRKLGMSMKVKSVSLEAVSSKISALIDKKLRKGEENKEENRLLERLGGKNGKDQGDVNGDENQEDQDQQQNEDSVKQEQLPKQQEVEQANGKQQEEEEEEDQGQQDQLEMMRMMGLPTAFGSKKHKR